MISAAWWVQWTVKWAMNWPTILDREDSSTYTNAVGGLQSTVSLVSSSLTSVWTGSEVFGWVRHWCLLIGSAIHHAWSITYTYIPKDTREGLLTKLPQEKGLLTKLPQAPFFRSWGSFVKFTYKVSWQKRPNFLKKGGLGQFCQEVFFLGQFCQKPFILFLGHGWARIEKTLQRRRLW